MATKKNTTHLHDPSDFKLRRETTESKPLEHQYILVLGIISALMLGISLGILSPETGPLAMLKVVLVTCSAGLVTYAVNRFSIEYGTALAAIGYQWAGIACIAAMLVAGSGMFIGSYSGLIFTAIDERVLQINSAALDLYISDINKAAIEAKRVGPALRLVANDLESWSLCEAQNSCLSHNGNGGFGPVAAETQKLSNRSDGIANAFDDGEVESRRLLREVNRLNSQYQNKLAESGGDTAVRRGSLQSIHSEIAQVTMALAEALPVSLLRTYTQELISGVTIAGQRNSTKSLNDILLKHGLTLSNILEEMDESDITAPAFPSRPGMLDSLKYMGDFAAFAAVIFVAELVLPITLWILTYQKLLWEIDRRSAPRAHSKKSGLFAGLIDLPPLKSDSGDLKGESK